MYGSIACVQKTAQTPIQNQPFQWYLFEPHATFFNRSIAFTWLVHIEREQIFQSGAKNFRKKFFLGGTSLGEPGIPPGAWPKASVGTALEFFSNPSPCLCCPLVFSVPDPKCETKVHVYVFQIYCFKCLSKLPLSMYRLTVLRKWRSKYGPSATYRNLAECFYNADKLRMAEAVCKALTPTTISVMGQLQGIV